MQVCNALPVLLTKKVGILNKAGAIWWSKGNPEPLATSIIRFQTTLFFCPKFTWMFHKCHWSFENPQSRNLLGSSLHWGSTMHLMIMIQRNLQNVIKLKSKIIYYIILHLILQTTRSIFHHVEHHKDTSESRLYIALITKNFKGSSYLRRALNQGQCFFE